MYIKHICKKTTKEKNKIQKIIKLPRMASESCDPR